MYSNKYAYSSGYNKYGSSSSSYHNRDPVLPGGTRGAYNYSSKQYQNNYDNGMDTYQTSSSRIGNQLSKTSNSNKQSSSYLHKQNVGGGYGTRNTGADRIYNENFRIRETKNSNDYEDPMQTRSKQSSSTFSSSEKKQQMLQSATRKRQEEEEQKMTYYEQQRQKRQSQGGPQVRDKTDKGIVGLNNIGNTCFMNSALQCLFNLPIFNDAFLNGQYQSELKKGHKGLAQEYANLLQSIRKGGSGGYGNKSESTYGIKRAIERKSSQFSGYQQQDAQELLRVVLDGLHEDLNRIRSKPVYRELSADTKKRSEGAIADDWFDYYKGRDDSLVCDYFTGQMMNKVICSVCYNESLAFDNFLDLSLSFTKGLQVIQDCSVERLLDHFLKEEPLDDEYHCSKCKKGRKSKRKFVLWKMPQILVLHLKRFKFGRTYSGSQKINTNVQFPITGLDLSNMVRDSSDPSVKDCVYDLCGVVNHSGSLYGGHYTADCMNPYDHRWYRFNDSHVHEIDIRNQRYHSDGSSSPYILFYAKRKIIQ